MQRHQPGERIAPAERESLEASLGHRFSNEGLLLQALTHRTWLKERQDRGLAHGREDQQRLEFLGDAFLGYVIGRRLFEQLPEADEGLLTDRRKLLVEGAWLTRVGERLGVAGLILLGRGEEANRWRNTRLLKDTVEALIGAVLLDGGEERARQVIDRLMPVQEHPEGAADPIIVFGQAYQHLYKENPPEPKYSPSGEDHLPIWTAKLTLKDGTVVSGVHSSRKEAKREACRQALLRMGWPV